MEEPRGGGGGSKEELFAQRGERGKYREVDKPAGGRDRSPPPHQQPQREPPRQEPRREDDRFAPPRQDPPRDDDRFAPRAEPKRDEGRREEPKAEAAKVPELMARLSVRGAAGGGEPKNKPAGLEIKGGAGRAPEVKKAEDGKPGPWGRQVSTCGCLREE